MVLMMLALLTRRLDIGCAAYGRAHGDLTVCRNIRTLYNFDPPVTDGEIRAASLQFVRKISGFTKPSRANEPAFDHAVEEVSAAVRTLMEALVTTGAPRDREVEALLRATRPFV